jgi:radical SAM superfamily enzyme YgiQ (UPF0313 family)
VVGGYTASFFCKDIMRDFPQVDFILRGDSEIPLLMLVKKILGKHNPKQLNKIPNLVYREKGKIKVNQQTYCTSSGMLGKLNFSHFDLLDNYRIYNKSSIFEGEINVDSCNNFYDNDGGIFFYNCGRGCPYNCSICGGSRLSQKIISNRTKIIYAPVASVVDNLKRAKEYGINTWYNTFDPSPRKEYFIKLFAEIRKAKLNLSLQFECLHIPTRQFILAAEKTFEKIRFDFVLQTGSERLRRLNKGNFYSNSDLLDVLKCLDKTKINVDLCFVAGLPFEDKEDVFNSLKFINLVRNKFTNVNIVVEILELEPASPCYLNNEKYMLVSKRKSLADFIKQHSVPSSAGYHTKNFSLSDINLIKKYYKAEANCRKDKSEFLYKLICRASSSKFDLRTLHKVCNVCEQYTLCFRGG